MKSRITGSVIAGLTALALAGCGGADTSDEPTAEPTATAAPSLKVPTVVKAGSNASIIVNGGDLERGTKATVYAFEGGWDRTKITCDDTTADAREVTITGDGSDQTVSIPVQAGIIGWVLVAEDFSTDCNEDGSITTAKIPGEAALLTDKAPSAVATERAITVFAKGIPETLPTTATVKVLGPWKTLPEAEAAKCETAPVVTTRSVEIPPSTESNASSQYGTTFTPDQAGIYRLTVAIPETEQSTAVDSCADGSDPKIFVVKAG